MSERLLTGNSAVAWGARLAQVDYVPAFPITPQTEIIETLAKWIEEGELNAKFVMMDGEHSMLMAAGGAAAAGARVFTATSSQGLLYAMEALYTVAGWRVPFVLANVSRGLSAPITLGPDHNDVFAARDSGMVQIHVENCQEALDAILLAYRIAEDERVYVPVLVNLDGFYLSFTREPVSIPSPEDLKDFLPVFQPKHPTFRAHHPVAHAPAVLDASAYSYFRYQSHRAVSNAAEVFVEVAREYETLTTRRYDPLDLYRMEDAEIVLVMVGSFASKGKAAVNRCRSRGIAAGLVRPRLLRPWPARELRIALRGRRAVGVLDQNLSPGLGGVLFTETAAALAGDRKPPLAMRSFISGLGGKDISSDELDHVFSELEDAKALSRREPELLMTSAEWDSVQDQLTIAGKTSEAVS